MGPHQTAQPHWLISLQPTLTLRFWLALLAQVALLLIIPVSALHTQMTGKTIVLQTGPVAPYNPLQGYYMQLNYEISTPAQLEALPGWEQVQSRARQLEATPNATASPSLFVPGLEVYVILQAPPENQQPPLPWQPIAVQLNAPTNLPPDQVALRGIYRRGQISFGIETYYIPEAQQAELNRQIQEVQISNGSRPFVVEVKVDAAGRAIPLGLWVGKERYQF
ncbi:MAG: GDYXXLXY domain-containing protein [Synechococcales cyanobacterium C42_A2020_086]|nr:GDYXXLXY domain-containing protein [Synechococcales cyanobacterium C42_A2020_086]